MPTAPPLHTASPRSGGSFGARRTLFLIGALVAAAGVLRPVGAHPSPFPEVSLGAQLDGVVLDRSGSPIEGATVEAWSASGRVATRVTDRRGAFRFPTDVADRTTALYAHRIGYRGLRIELPAGGGPVELRLEEDAVSLPGVDVIAARDLCPRTADPAARALWEATRSRYMHGLDTMGVASYLQQTRGLVSRETLSALPALGGGGNAGASVAEEQRGSSFLLRLSWRRRIEREGYAYPVRRPTAEGSALSWVYPPLEADFAPHFLEPAFAQAHHLSFLPREEEEEGWRIAFCPRNTGRPGIQGILHVTADSTLTLAEWRFRTGEPDEEAGGRARFASPGEGGAYLLPVEGVQWRRSAEEVGFVRTLERYEGWIIAPGDSVPFLPSRTGGY